MITEVLGKSFFVAAQELGMWSASTLFARELVAHGGLASLDAARDLLRRDFPVFDAVAGRWLDVGGSPAPFNFEEAARGLDGTVRVVVVGYDADPLDGLVAALPASVRVGVVMSVGELCGDVARALAPYGDRVAHVPLAEMPRWAGRRSGLVTFVYGVSSGATAYASLAWLRALGPDVRTQFRSLVGVDLLGEAPGVHPRWVVPASIDDFSDLVRA